MNIKECKLRILIREIVLKCENHNIQANSIITINEKKTKTHHLVTKKSYFIEFCQD